MMAGLSQRLIRLRLTLVRQAFGGRGDGGSPKALSIS
jgi:hypothetical protein